MNLKLSLFLFVVGQTVAVLAESPLKCRVCDKTLEGMYFHTLDRARGGLMDVCTNCVSLESRCFACGLPVKPDGNKLEDGRYLCPRDHQEAIRDDEEAKKVCSETRDELERAYGPLIAFPTTNVVVNIVDQFTLESLFKSPGYGKRCSSVFGATRSGDLGKGQFVHSISVLSGLSKAKLEAVSAHEFGHTWLNENLRGERRASVARDAVEGFCELLAYELAEQRGNEIEKKSIRDNPYTRGQLEAFLAAKNRHGITAIVDWMKSGEAEKLDSADPDSVNALRAPKPATTVAAVNYSSAPAQLLPNKLTLKGISGAGTRRFAIINDRTFGINDSAKMRLATTTVTLRCLEIRTNSVLIQVDGEGGKQELFLPGF